MEKIEEIKKLKSLLDQGAITNEEFNSLKNNVINQQLSESQIAPISLTNQFKPSTKSYRKAFIISIVSLVFTLAVLALVLNHAKLIPTTSLLQPKQDEFGREYVYEEGKNLGVIVKLEIESRYLNHGTNGAQHEIGNLMHLNIPDGKMWTPLYYETTQGSIHPKISFLPKYKGENYMSAAEYRFSVKKEEFVSCKVAKLNFKPLIRKNEATINCYNPWYGKYIVYFLEESY